MSDNKKYYYLKLKENFFESDEMIILESMKEGYLYSNILLKLYLRSLKNEGRLMFKERIPYNPTILAQIIRHDVGNVERALKIFQELGLIEVLDNGAIYVLDVQNFVGKSSTEADRIRSYRKEIEKEKQQLLEGNTESVQMYDKSTPEIELEKDIDKEKDYEHFFEILWKMYPKKLGKGGVSKTQKKQLQKISIEEWERAISRFTKHMQTEKRTIDTYPYGGTFFKTSYIDYLDANYTESKEPSSKNPYNVNGR